MTVCRYNLKLRLYFIALIFYHYSFEKLEGFMFFLKLSRFIYYGCEGINVNCLLHSVNLFITKRNTPKVIDSIITMCHVSSFFSRGTMLKDVGYQGNLCKIIGESSADLVTKLCRFANASRS